MLNLGVMLEKWIVLVDAVSSMLLWQYNCNYLSCWYRLLDWKSKTLMTSNYDHFMDVFHTRML